MTYSFVPEEMATGTTDKIHHLKVANPLSREQAYLRQAIVPSLLAAAGQNDRYATEFGLFELSRVFVPGKDHAQLPAEPFCLAVLVKGVDEVYPRIKGILDALAAAWGLALEVKLSGEDEGFLPGKLGQIRLGGKVVGHIGELEPKLTEAAGVSGRVAALEVNVDELLAAAQDVRPQLPGRYPSLTRDVNLVVKRSVTWADVERVILDSTLAKPLFVNDYYPDNLAPDCKNLAVRLVMNDPHKTLTETEAAARLKIIQVHLHKQLGAEAV